MMSKIPVAVLAATGSVGQRFVQLLDNHPWFEVVVLTGSDRTAGQTYGQSCHWILPGPMPEWAAGLEVKPSEPGAVGNLPLVFSGLPASIAREVEPQFAQAGAAVCSNASAYRRDPDVPILLPEVNADHAGIIPLQRQRRGWTGCIVTNPNCTSTGLTVALKALQARFGLRKVFAVSLQALSGAGYPGVASLDIIDNVIPYIGDEEDKIEWETRKMLGKFNGAQLELASFTVSAHANRVAVSDGHTICCSVELEEKASPEEAQSALQDYQPPQLARGLPSTPQPVIEIRSEPDRPQPRLDRNTGKGMTTVVGRLRPDPLFDLKMVVLSHNTIRGAAGGAIYNGELLAAMELLPK
ncbi:MAG TPA: aspartate-semialdehyde dehydrogenase [Anaerolineaceae bacterium]|jgi:aspartate-semialdehyde dehydrogenase